MEKFFSKLLAEGLITLTMAGFKPTKKRTKRFKGLMNVDLAHSALRVPLTLALLRGAMPASNVKMTRIVLRGVGGVYIAIGTAGLIDKKVGGLLPSGLTNFDIAYHLGVGAAALWLGYRPGRMMKP